MTGFVEEIVGQLQLIEGDDLLHPLDAFGWRVWMDVNTSRHLRIGLSSNDPAGVVEAVAISFVVTSDEVDHQHVVG